MIPQVNMPSLPQDMIKLIIEKSAPVDVMNWACVSKQFKALADVKNHSE
jgi:hypothetical protein